MVCRTVLVDIPLVLLVDPSLGHLVLLAKFLELQFGSKMLSVTVSIFLLDL